MVTSSKALNSILSELTIVVITLLCILQNWLMRKKNEVSINKSLNVFYLQLLTGSSKSLQSIILEYNSEEFS